MATTKIRRRKTTTTNRRPSITNPRCHADVAKKRNGDDVPIPEAKHMGRYHTQFGFDGCAKIVAFQNAVLASNVDMQLDDAQLAILFAVNHPLSHGQMHAGTVKGMRRSYNLGRHGNTVPKMSSTQYPSRTVDGVAYVLNVDGIPKNHVQDRRGHIVAKPEVITI